MTDTTVATLTDDEIVAMREKHQPWSNFSDAACVGCGRDSDGAYIRWTLCPMNRALDALDAAQRRVVRLERACEVYRQELNAVRRDIHAALAAPHDVEGDTP